MKEPDYLEPMVRYTDEDDLDEGGEGSSNVERDEVLFVDEDHVLEVVDVPAPKPRRSWLSRCSKCLLMGVIAVLGLIFVVLLLLSRASSTRHGSTPGNRPGHHRGGHNKSPAMPVKAVPYKLDFPGLYPAIRAEASPECHAAWDELSKVPCHDKVFDRGNDNGTFRLMGWDPMYFLPKICTEECRNTLRDAHSRLSAHCSPEDTFVLDGYKGMFKTELLEAGPTLAVDTLVRRMDVQCRSSPNGDSDYEYCPTEMRERFWLIDGLNANLVGIDGFLGQTKSRRVEPAQRKRGRKGTSKYSYRYDYRVREQRYGPGEGETSCGWCAFDYLNRTLSSWVEGRILNPKSNEPVTLPEFIRRVRTAGSRCAPKAQWNKIYSEAVQRYQAAGILQPDWETSLPSGDLDYLILNGPSAGDPPVSSIKAELARLDSAEDNQSWQAKNAKVCLNSLSDRYTSAKCYINLSHDKLVSMMDKDSKKLREAYCSSDCTDALNRKERSPRCDAASTTAKTRELLDDFRDATKQRDAFCRDISKNWQSSNCAQAFLNMGKAQWAFEGRPDSSSLIKDASHALEQLKQKLVPEDLRDKFEENPELLPQGRKEFERRMEIGSNVCAECVWNWLVGIELKDRMSYISSAESGPDYVDFVKKYHKTCSALGAHWLGDLPYGDDPAIWRVKAKEGRVYRMIQVSDRRGRKSVYQVTESSGSVSFYEREERMNRPGVDVATLWHLLEAERAVKADEEGRYEQWKADEEKHRKDADDKIWEVDTKWFSPTVKYIGPVPLEY